MNASNDRLLRRTLWGNAVLSVLSGGLLAAYATPFAAWATHEPLSVAGVGLSLVFKVLGLGFIAFGAACGWAASRERLSRAWARAIFAADVAWVAGSALVLVLPVSWTTAGIAGIVVVALVVADLAILEYLGLRRLSAAH